LAGGRGRGAVGGEGGHKYNININITKFRSALDNGGYMVGFLGRTTVFFCERVVFSRRGRDTFSPLSP